MTPDNPNEIELPPQNLATLHVAHRYCLPLVIAALVAASAGIGERSE
jgi:hypothetical protein